MGVHRGARWATAPHMNLANILKTVQTFLPTHENLFVPENLIAHPGTFLLPSPSENFFVDAHLYVNA